jgi:amidohydrolase
MTNLSTHHADPKGRARTTITAEEAPLRALSRAIHSHPELAYEETFAHAALTDFLEARGFEVTREAHGLTTSFRAVRGHGTPVIAFLCEYDALPDIGHACGHNLVATAGVAGALGAAAALDESGAAGTVVVIGCPAEERYGGKADLIKAGAFAGVDVAMMAHTSRADIAQPATSARHGLIVTFHGRAAHAAGAPWGGINALDALVTAYQSIGLLRQQLPSDVRVHMIITEGGVAPNVIPERSQGVCFLRAPDAKRLTDLRERVLACFEGAAQAAGCTIEIEWDGNPYLNMVASPPVANAYVKNMGDLGITVEATPVPRAGSTDMGNVSHVVPAIQPIFVIPGDIGNHTPAFTALAATDAAFEVTLRAGTGLAWTAIDLFTNPDLLTEVTREFERRDT